MEPGTWKMEDGGRASMVAISLLRDEPVAATGPTLIQGGPQIPQKPIWGATLNLREFF
jgi:hypothetical protein